MVGTISYCIILQQLTTLITVILNHCIMSCPLKTCTGKKAPVSTAILCEEVKNIIYFCSSTLIFSIEVVKTNTFTNFNTSYSLIILYRGNWFFYAPEGQFPVTNQVITFFLIAVENITTTTLTRSKQVI